MIVSEIFSPENENNDEDNEENYLSDEQREVLKLVLEGKNIFLTGRAGTGKTFLLRAVVKNLKRIYPPGSVFVTAPTGIAATNLGKINKNLFNQLIIVLF